MHHTNFTGCISCPNSEESPPPMKILIPLFLFLALASANAQEKTFVPPTSGFTVKGIVTNELTLKISDLEQYKQDELHDVVIRNQKGEQKRVAKSMRGILLKAVLESAGVHAEKPKD